MNQRMLKLLNPAEVMVRIRLVDEAEVDEMWSFVGRKEHPRKTGQQVVDRVL